MTKKIELNTECSECGALFHTEPEEIGTVVECPCCEAPVKVVWLAVPYAMEAV